MKTRKFFYVYTDENTLIKNIELDKKEYPSLVEYQLPIDQGESFLNLKREWDSGAYRKTYVLARGGERYMTFGYFPKGITYVYYEKKKKTIKCISPVLTDEYKDNKLITHGMVAFDSLVENFVSGEMSLTRYEIKETKPLLEFVKIDILQEIELSDIQLLKSYKINFVEEGREIELRYNRKRKELIIHCVYKLPISIIFLHFTKKDDRTILYQSINGKFENNTILISEVDLPIDFDVYSSFDIEYKFLYMEEIEKNE